jgi:hypothetical protein
MNRWIQRHYSNTAVATPVAEQTQAIVEIKPSSGRSGTIFLLGRDTLQGLEQAVKVKLTYDEEVGGWDNLSNNDFDKDLRSDKQDQMMLVFESKPKDPNKRPEEQPWPTIRLTYGDPK